MLIYQNMCTNQIHNLWKFGGDTILQTYMKILKKRRYKIKGRRSITFCYIWLINASKCVYQLDTYLCKFGERYVLPKTNAVHYLQNLQSVLPHRQFQRNVISK